MLENQETDFYHIEQEFQLVQGDFVTYMKEDTSWHRLESTGSMISFLDIVFSILLCAVIRNSFIQQ